MSESRRSFFARAGALAAAQGLILEAQQTPTPRAPMKGGSQPSGGRIDPRAGTHDVAKQYSYSDKRAKVALIKGESRRKNVYEALVAIDDQILPRLKTRKYVIIKPNGLDPRPDANLGSTKGDAVHGILDYLGPRFKGPVLVAEHGMVPTKQAVSEYGWDKLFAEHKPLDIKLELPNEEGSHYEILYGIDYDMHPLPIRLAARFLDPDAFLISSSVMKTHNVVVATLSIKNVVMGSPLRPPPGQDRSYQQSETRKFHVGIRSSNLNMYYAFQRLISNWGVGLIDGFEGMEGNGPGSGTPVPSRIVVASADALAADRVGVECMGMDAGWLGYLNYSYEAGLGQYDLDKIDVLGAKIADVQRKYRLHADFDRMLDWQGQMKDLPQTL